MTSELISFLLQQAAFCFAAGFLATAVWPDKFGAFTRKD